MHSNKEGGRNEVAARPSIETVKPRVAYLDGWRGVSIILVLVGHFINTPGTRLSWIGVEFFFVLSGRLMAEILFVEQFSLPKFYIRRVARVFPALIVFAIGCFFLVYKTSLHFKPLAVLMALSMVYNYIAASGHHLGALDHIWSLCIEEHAYLILGFISLASRRWKLPVPGILMAITAISMTDGVLSAVVLHQDWFADYWRTDAHLGSIFGPAAIYLWSQPGGPLKFLRDSPYVPFVFGILGLATSIAIVPVWVSYTFGTLCLSISVCTLDNAWIWLRNSLSAKVLTITGVLSFSIYLWQQPFCKMAESAPLRIELLFFLAAILLGVASYFIVEKPVRRLLNRAGDRLLVRLSRGAN